MIQIDGLHLGGDLVLVAGTAVEGEVTRNVKRWRDDAYRLAMS
ncbi:hypothetical protein [Bradyrhizobium sp. 174]|nr:hypothetical protein [Bradyrhizobium sp. 174]